MAIRNPGESRARSLPTDMRHGSREVRWWMSSTKLQSNLAFVEAHPGIMTGLYTYVGLAIAANGSMTIPHDDAWLEAHLKPYLDLGLTVTPALALADDALANGTSWRHVDEVAAWAKRNRFSGVMLDYEPHTSAAERVHQYAAFVGNLSRAMHVAGLQAEMCVSSWGILDGHSTPQGYGVYSSTGVDRMMSMAGTYFGTNLTKNFHNVQLELAQGVSVSQLAVGVGTMIQSGCATGPAKWNYNWTEGRLREFVGYLENRSVSRLSFWRADIDDEGECTESYYFDVARRFLGGSSWITAEPIAINPRLFGFSSYLGPVVNLSYSDAAVLRAAAVLRMGTLRYPGGSTANSWDMERGRWVVGAGGAYANRTDWLPTGTYTPRAYMAGVGQLLPAAPIWNLNLLTLPDPPSQLDVLRRSAVPVEYVELGNEKIDEPPGAYLDVAAPVVARTRALFPHAQVSVVGCFGTPWRPCAARLRAAFHSRRLFDAVSIHMYAPTNATIVAHAKGDAERRVATLAAVGPALRELEERVARDIDPRVPIWLDEFNWGGDWANVTWPAEQHGALRGLNWAAYILSALDVTARAQGAGRSGFGSLDYYALFHQPGNPWSRWAGCVSVSNHADRPDDVKLNGVSQIIAHVNSIVFSRGHTHVAVLSGLTTALVPTSLHLPHQRGDESCVLGARFSSDGHAAVDEVLLNMCAEEVMIVPPLSDGLELISWHWYSGFDVGRGWVAADRIGSLQLPPWSDGPLTVHHCASDDAPATRELRLPAVSLSVVSKQRRR